MNSYWYISGVSVQGTSHTIREVPCQDAFELKRMEEGSIILAFADGAGSARQSQIGSNLVVKASVSHLCEAIQKEITSDRLSFSEMFQSAFQCAVQSLQEYATANEIPMRELSTTLQLFAISRGWLLYGQIGDGALVVKKEDGTYQILAKPVVGEYANETFFLTEENVRQYLQTYFDQGEITAFAGMTDGVTKIAIDLQNWAPSVPFFDAIFQRFQVCQDQEAGQDFLHQFLQSERVNNRTDDDKTLILGCVKVLTENT